MTSKLRTSTGSYFIQLANALDGGTMYVAMEKRRSVIIACVVLLQLWTTAVAYNLDTKFPIIYSSSLGDYFGYSVALHENSDGFMALVGAPRANSTILIDPVHQPGVLFKCNVPLTSSVKAECEEVTLYTRGNTQTVLSREFSYYDKKDDMWLGVSLDIQQGQKDIVTCGHLWKNQYYKEHYFANGVCYVINSDLDPYSVKKLVPLIQRSKQINPSGTYYYGYGQAGTSAAYSEDGKTLILGAPGLYHWIGGIVSYHTDPERSRDIYKNPAIPESPGGVSPDSYLGYSVTSGKFFDNNIFYAVGAPRDSGQHGRVYIFKALEHRKDGIFVHLKKEGTQFGEYFGATVLGINLNGDSYTDLLVGAPFHSLDSGGDEGKVVVYISNGVGLQTYAELLGGSKPNARFGSAIANVGDLNQDGFIDVAIGAPYEDGNGAVYIYHGAKTGMNVQYAQKIEATSIDSRLSGFGIQISRGLDIDNNKYPDILIGSYASSNAVLFRTRPVVQMSPEVIFSPKQITNLTDCEFNGENLRCVNVSACLRYAGKHVPHTLDFENDIFVEHPNQTNMISPRGFFVNDGKQGDQISERTKLKFRTNTCFKRLLYIYSDVKDIVTPIEILFRYRLYVPPRADDEFDKSFPIIDSSTPTSVTSGITFQKGCGLDDKCLSNLVVSAKLLGVANSGELILGVVSSVSLAITVSNNDDPAYLAELLVYLPPEMPIINLDAHTSTSQRPNVSLVYELGNPLMKGTEVNILIKLDATKITTDRKNLEIFLEAVTVSTETAPEDNTLSIPLHFQAIADIAITGASAQEQVLYDEDEHFNITIPISHTYIVRNHGPSPLQTIDIIIYVPIAYLQSAGRMQFLTFTSLEADSGKQLTIPAQCNDTYLSLKRVMPKVKPRKQTFSEDKLVAADTVSLPLYNHSFGIKPSRLTMDFEDSNIVVRSKRNSEKSKMTSSKARETILINCESENIDCIAIQCSASPFTDIQKIAQITVTAEVNMTILSNYLGPWYRIELITVGKVTMRDTNVQQFDGHPDVAQVKTVFIHNVLPPSEEMDWWIIFVSIGAGILLLLIILIVLVKIGFFERKQKEKMQELMDGDATDYDATDYDAMESDALEDVSTENDNLN